MQDYKTEMIKKVVIWWVFCFGISIIVEQAVSPHIEMGFALGFTSFLYFITEFKFYAI